MVALVDVRRWDAGKLEAVLTELRTAQDAAVELDHALTGSRPPDDWTGSSSTVARFEQARLAEELRRLVAGVAAVRPWVADAADAVLGIQRGIADAEAVAGAHGFVIAPDGAISDPNPPVVPAADVELVRRERETIQAEILGRLEQVLRRADEVDAALADVLARATDGEIDDGTGSSLAGAAATGAAGAGEALSVSVPPPDAGPADNAAWWSSLSDTERAEVVVTRPDQVGNRDGLPAAVRHEANIARLPGEIDRIDGELAAARAGGDQGLVDELSAKREALTTLQQVGGAPDRQLLAFDATGRHVTAAVAQGDVDTADHVAVFTPGLGTTVQGSLGGYDDALDRLRLESRNVAFDEGTGSGVATIAWLGYEAPQWEEVNFVGPGPAERGAERLTGFVGGLEASRTGDYHLTTLGHSYGSLTTGLALRDTVGVDDAILFGSPGIGTNDVTDLQVPEGNTWVAEAEADIVADAAWFGPDPNQLDGVTVLSTGDGVDPTTGEALVPNHGHDATGPAPGTYFGEDSTARHNFAGVVAGADPDRLLLGDEWDWADHLNAPFTWHSGN